jgi:hypothetical protein
VALKLSLFLFSSTSSALTSRLQLGLFEQERVAAEPTLLSGVWELLIFVVYIAHWKVTVVCCSGTQAFSWRTLPHYCQKGGNTMYISVDFNHVNDCADRTVMDHVDHERDAYGK